MNKTTTAVGLHSKHNIADSKYYGVGISWIKSNIFNNAVLDASLYLIFYIAIPITMGFISMKISKDKPLDRIYCYIGLIINACGCGYDLINRRENQEKSVKNTKLWIMGAFVIAVIIACLIGIILVTLRLPTEVPDILLFSYFVVVFVALSDIIPSLISHSNWKLPIPDEVL